MKEEKHRFVLLDGLRGIAAMLVVQRHVSPLFFQVLPSAYLAVDLFFVLSGFVIAFAYEEKLKSSRISFKRFMILRLLRLYPLYILAFLLMLYFYVDTGGTIGETGRTSLLVGTIFSLVFLPSPIALSFNQGLFVVLPAWSLFNELVVNVAYGLAVKWLNTRKIAIIMAISGALLVFAVYKFGKLDVGFHRHDLYGGMARVFYSFFAGVLIFRYRHLSRPLPAAVGGLCMLALVAVLCLPVTAGLRPVYDIAAALIILPALVFVSSSVRMGEASGKACLFIGSASYAVYVLHVPFGEWTMHIFPLLFGTAAENYAPWAGIVFLTVLVVIGWALDKYFDAPIRRYLSKVWFGTPRTKGLAATPL